MRLSSALAATLLSCALAAPAAADPLAPPAHAPDSARDEEGARTCGAPGARVDDIILQRASRAGERVRATRTLPKDGTTLAGRVVALSAGHGSVVQDDGTGWGWQRSVTHELREDIHTNQWMIDFVIPYLERAGAEVVTMRERHYGVWSQRVDDTDAGYEESGVWSEGSRAGFDGGAYRYAEGGSGARATWTFTAEATETAPLSAYVVTGSNRSAEATYTARGSFGARTFVLDQTQRFFEDDTAASSDTLPPLSDVARGSADLWFRLGELPVREGEVVTVTLDASPSEAAGVVIADAMQLGAGVGESTDTLGVTSGRARWQESASAHIAWQGAPEWLQVGDVSSRPLYAIYRGADVYISMHTNCCDASGTSTYTWYPEMFVREANWAPGFAEEQLPPGTYAFSDLVHDAVIARVRATWDSVWDDDGHRGANFGELRPIRNAWANDVAAGIDPPVAIPAFLMEVAYHDTAYDASLIRELDFRHEVARGIVAGVIRYFGGQDAVVPPYPPEAVRASATDEGLLLEWEPRLDPVEPSAAPTEFHVFVSEDGVLFERHGVTGDTRYVVPLDGCAPRYVRVDAANEGGRSLDGTTLAVAAPREGAARALYVDGVDREVAQVTDPTRLRSYARIYGPAMHEAREGMGFDSVTDEAAVSALDARDYDVVVWALGETSTRDETLDAAQQQALRRYLAEGGRLIVSGAELGWDLVERGSDEDAAFFRDALGARYLADDADATTLDASPLGASLSAVVFGDCSVDAHCVEYPDVLSPAGGGAFLATYPSGDAAIVLDPSESVIVSGVPLESIADADEREALLEALLRSVVPAPDRVGACAQPPEPPGQGEPDAGGLADATMSDDDATPRGDDARSSDTSGERADRPVRDGDDRDGEGKQGCTVSSTPRRAPWGLAAAFALAYGIRRRQMGGGAPTPKPSA